jgi:hypothetical protein
VRDVLGDTARLGIIAPLRKCEWCHEPAQRGADLCLPCEKRWAVELLVPMDAGCEAECVFGIHRAMGVFW